MTDDRKDGAVPAGATAGAADEATEEAAEIGRAAQDAAGALARMGIDPGVLGLQAPRPAAPLPAAPVSAGPTSPAGGPPTSAPPGPYPPAPPVQPGQRHPHQPTLREQPEGGLAIPPPERRGLPPVGAGRIVGRAAPMPPGAPPEGDGVGAPPPTAPGTFLRRPLGDPAQPQPLGPPVGPDPAAIRAAAGPAHPPRTGFGGLRQLARGAGKGLLAPSAASSVQQERELIARVRARQREPRLTTFFSTVGGAGTTTTCAGVALALATVRGDQAALLDVQAGTRSLAARVVGTSSVSASDVIRAGGIAALPQPPATIGTLAVIDSAPWYSPAERGDLVELLHQVRTMYPFTVLDAGDEVSGTAHAMLSRADRLVLVQPANPDLVDAVQYAMARINQVDPARLRQLVVAVVGMTNRSYRHAVRRLGALLGRSQRVVLVPYDRALVGGGPISLGALRPSTREAYLALAAFAAERTEEHPEQPPQPMPPPMPPAHQPMPPPVAQPPAPAGYGPAGWGPAPAGSPMPGPR